MKLKEIIKLVGFFIGGLALFFLVMPWVLKAMCDYAYWVMNF